MPQKYYSVQKIFGIKYDNYMVFLQTPPKIIHLSFWIKTKMLTISQPDSKISSKYFVEYFEQNSKSEWLAEK